MRRYFKHILAILTSFFLISCSIENLEPNLPTSSSSGDITILGRITSFKDVDVATRGAKVESETTVSTVAMAIFEVNEEGSGLGDCVAFDYRPDASLMFDIERSSDIVRNDRYAIYIFANMPGLEEFEEANLTEITLEDLLSCNLTVTNADIPKNGFPMIGSLGDTFSTLIDQDGKELILSPENADGDLTNPQIKDSKTGTTEELSILPIGLKAMYAKINFSISVNPDQTVEGNYPPQFTIKGYTINNIPNKVDFNYDTNDASSVINTITGKQITGNHSSTNIEQKIEFSFYIPERLLTPATTWDQYQYPFGKGEGTEEGNIRPEDMKYRQRYKSKLLGSNQKGTNVVISGDFRDHQNHSYEITYTIHLGEDEYGNFDIKRNNEYNNIITIAGIQASSDESITNKVFIDHRVDITHKQPAIISLHREVLLDSHFEIRPLRIKQNDIEGTDNIKYVRVEVLEPETTNWMRIERSLGVGTEAYGKTNGVGDSIYITEDESASKGKRRYFTYNLVNGLGTDGVSTDVTNYSLVNSTSVIVPLDQGNQCVWIYVDECIDPGDGVRSGQIKITYLDANGNDIVDSRFPPIVYTISQRKLFQVTGGDSGRAYDIEYYEEYLHNFDEEDDYLQTQYEGMKWGLDGIQLSYDNQALYFDTNIDLFDFFINLLKNIYGMNPVYDFYIPKHDTGVSDYTTKRAYSGYVFSNEIIQDINGYRDRDTDDSNDIDVLSLNEQPKSAIEYCYNKNKRNAEGHVVWQSGYNRYNTDNLNWYLPAIDEIEDIVMSEYTTIDETTENPTTLKTYGRFPEFQDKYYWSSQPAYIRNYAHYNIYISVPGSYYYDDTTRARATKVSINSTTNDYDYEYSGTIGYYNAIRIHNRILDPKYEFHESGTYNNQVLGTINYQPGNKARTDKARVRCVRKSADTVTE